MNVSVSSESTAQRVALPLPGAAMQSDVTQVFAWMATSGESEGLRLTREILSDPDALAEIRAAREEIARGDVVRGVDNVRALRPRR